MASPISHTLLLALLSALTAASPGFDCSNIVSRGVRWNLKELEGPREVSWLQTIEPSVHNFTFTLDICKPLLRHKGVVKEDECPGNTRVCGIEYIQNTHDNSSSIAQVVPIAGDYSMQTGVHLDSEVFRLKNSGSSVDSAKEGVRVELSGGKQPLTSKGKPQKAIIEFLCDPDNDGKDTDMDERPEDPDNKDAKLRRRDEDKPKERSLKFLTYEDVTDPKKNNEVWGVLRLEWKTKYACEDAVDAPKEGGTSGSWGFFTWMIIVVFLATAAYLIFGSWLNYNRYGARGWDALPHSDTLRDIPYIMQDFGRKVASTVQGGGTRGGYSAV